MLAIEYVSRSHNGHVFGIGADTVSKTLEQKLPWKPCRRAYIGAIKFDGWYILEEIMVERVRVCLPWTVVNQWIWLCGGCSCVAGFSGCYSWKSRRSRISAAWNGGIWSLVTSLAEWGIGFRVWDEYWGVSLRRRWKRSRKKLFPPPSPFQTRAWWRKQLLPRSLVSPSKWYNISILISNSKANPSLGKRS
jgi:hypothetical protein